MHLNLCASSGLNTPYNGCRLIWHGPNLDKIETWKANNFQKDIFSKNLRHDGSENLLLCLRLVWFQCSIEGIKGEMIKKSWCISPNCDILHLPKIVHLMYGGTTVSWPAVPSCALAALFPVKWTKSISCNIQSSQV